MPLPELLSLAEQFRARALAGERAHAIRLVRAYALAVKPLNAGIDALAAEIAGMDVPTIAKVERLARWRGLRLQIQAEIDRYSKFAGFEIASGQGDMVAAGLAQSRALAQAALPGVGRIDAAIMSHWQDLRQADVETAVGFFEPDSPLRKGLEAELGKATAKSVADKLIEGVALGRNPRVVAAQMRSALGTGLTSSLKVSRTVMMYSSREATRAGYLANQHIVKGWTWVAAMDDRTCMSCMAMNGTEHPLTESLNDHWQGRCSSIPTTVTYRDLGFDVPEVVQPVESGEKWFRRQPEATQRAMMGEGKYKAWKNGEFQFSELSHVANDAVFGPMRTETSLKDLIAAQGGQKAA